MTNPLFHTSISYPLCSHKPIERYYENSHKLHAQTPANSSSLSSSLSASHPLFPTLP